MQALTTKADGLYAQYGQEFALAKKYQTNAEYWLIVARLLIEEKELHTEHPRDFRRMHRGFLRLRKRNLKMAKKMHKKYVKTYNAWLKEQ